MPLQCWHCKCGTQPKTKTCPKIIITAEPSKPKPNLLFHIYPISYHTFHFNLILLLCTLQNPNSNLFCKSMAATPSLTGALSNSLGLRDWRNHAPLSTSLCQSFSSFIFIWVISRFVKIATFLRYLCQCLCFCHAWVLGFQLVCLNCCTIFFAYF